VSATIAVLGPGGVGGTLAVRLALAGNRVICVARTDTAAAIVQGGLTLESQGETLHARPEAVAQLEEPVDLLLVTVKAFGLDDALERVVQTTVAKGVVLPLLNGLEHVDSIRGRLGPGVAAGSIGRLEAYRRGATTIVQTSLTPLVSAASDSLAPAALARSLEVLRVPGIELRLAANEKHVLWEKAARLAPLAAVTSVTQRSLGELRGDRACREQLLAAVKETCLVAVADGVDVSAAAQWEMIEAMPATLTTSTARDVAAGRSSEVDAIVGSVIRAGRRLGVPTPTLADLFELLEAA
jgi:2-dehydropantoate 2-reductase